MQQNWNLVAASGRKVSEQTYRGTKEQVDAYIQMMYDERHIKAVPAEVVDLNALTFEIVPGEFTKEESKVFKCKDGDVHLFTFEVMGSSVAIYGEDNIEEARIGLNFFLIYPKFAVQIAKSFTYG